MAEGENSSVRPVPHPTPLTQPFWDACRERRLIVQRCDSCGAHIFVPQSFCRSCQSQELTWVEGSGSGTIVTYTVVWRAQTPAFDVPYIVAVVRLDEGYEMMTNIVEADPDEVSVGAAVRVEFVDVTPDVTLPCFRVTADREPVTVE